MQILLTTVRRFTNPFWCVHWWFAWPSEEQVCLIHPVPKFLHERMSRWRNYLWQNFLWRNVYVTNFPVKYCLFDLLYMWRNVMWWNVCDKTSCDKMSVIRMATTIKSNRKWWFSFSKIILADIAYYNIDNYDI